MNDKKLHISFLGLSFVMALCLATHAHAATIGCDPAVLEQGKAIADALHQQNVETANALITQPTPIEQLTCAEQYTETMNKVGGIQSNPGGDISGSIGPLVQQPFQGMMQQFMGGNIAGSITSVMNDSYSNIASQFLGGLTGGLTGGSSGGSGTNCDMMDQAWLVSQCIEMPQLPSLSNILDGKIGEITGAIGGAVNPERLLEKVCSRASDKMGEYMSDLTGAFDGAVDAVTTPISDTANSLSF